VIAFSDIYDGGKDQEEKRMGLAQFAGDGLKSRKEREDPQDTEVTASATP